MEGSPKVVDFKKERKLRKTFKKGKYLEFKVDFTNFYKLLEKTNGNTQNNYKKSGS